MGTLSWSTTDAMPKIVKVIAMGICSGTLRFLASTHPSVRFILIRLHFNSEKSRKGIPHKSLESAYRYKIVYVTVAVKNRCLPKTDQN